MACYDAAEFVVKVANTPFQNPFTEAELSGVFRAGDGPPVAVPGFADADDGSVFRLRFCPQQAGAVYRYEIKFSGGGLQRQFTGDLTCTPSGCPGPVIVDPASPQALPVRRRRNGPSITSAIRPTTCSIRPTS